MLHVKTDMCTVFVWAAFCKTGLKSCVYNFHSFVFWNKILSERNCLVQKTLCVPKTWCDRGVTEARKNHNHTNKFHNWCWWHMHHINSWHINPKPEPSSMYVIMLSICTYSNIMWAAKPFQQFPAEPFWKPPPIFRVAIRQQCRVQLTFWQAGCKGICCT